MHRKRFSLYALDACSAPTVFVCVFMYSFIWRKMYHSQSIAKCANACLPHQRWYSVT